MVLLIMRSIDKLVLFKTAIGRTVIRPAANHRRELDYMLTACPQAAKAGKSLPPSSHSGGYMGLPRGQSNEGQKWGNGRRRQKGAEEAEGKYDINQVGEIEKWILEECATRDKPDRGILTICPP